MKQNGYKSHALSKRDATVVHDVEVPSGYVWKLTDPPLQQFITAGKIPSSLIAKLAVLAKTQPGEKAMAIVDELSADELISTLAFGRDLLFACAVEPKISVNPQSDDEIAPEDILPEDFNFLMNWVVSGGKSGDNLSTFRPE